MYRAAIATILPFVLLATPESHAQTVWLCRLTEDAVRLACVAEFDPANATERAPGASTNINGTSFPLDPRRMYFIDLWSPPTDMAFVEELAQATVCFRSDGCKAITLGESWSTAAFSKTGGPAELRARWSTIGTSSSSHTKPQSRSGILQN